MLNVDRTARLETPASPERCRAVLAGVERYPEWSTLIAEVEVMDRGADGVPTRVRLRAQVLGFAVAMRCALELRDDGAALRRISHGANDNERFDASWTVTPAGTGSTVDLHLVAAIDAPGPARLLGGRIAGTLVDGLLADFARAL